MGLLQRKGRTGEDAAVTYLRRQGYRIVERNWRPGNQLRGEIDCIAWHGSILCFIEVKSRTSQQRGAPQEAVDARKQQQICRLANAYISRRRLDVPCRFDVVEVWLEVGTETLLKLHQNAFEYDDHRRPGRIF